jgi:FixJ family two-component response regulator
LAIRHPGRIDAGGNTGRAFDSLIDGLYCASVPSAGISLPTVLRRTSEWGRMKQEAERQPVVFVVDDDPSVCAALKSLFGSVGLHAETFGSAPDFLARKLPDAPSCLVLDVRLPGLSGLDFQAELTKAAIRIPIVFVTGHGDIPMTVRAMKAGAVEFLTKPFREQDLLDAVQLGLKRDRERREGERATADVRGRFAALTPREKEVVSLVTAGMMNKQIAGDMGVSEITVKVHRGNAMRKMGARSLADLVKMMDALRRGGLDPS